MIVVARIAELSEQSFLRRSTIERDLWLERPGVTMSLAEAYEKWKTIKASIAPAG